MTTDLLAWQRGRLEALRACRYEAPRCTGVTALVYHFWDEALFDRQFELVESAIYETWRCCGRLRTCVVANRVTPALEAFASRHGGAVEVKLCPALVPGQVESMSVDCNANLHRYFDTEHVLVIQNDGFPLREGLDAFVGRYDYVGAPFVRKTRLNRLLGLWPRFAVGNGGFSLRSKRICEAAAYYWNRRYYRLPATHRFVREDAFYCFLLPFLEPAYRREMRFAPWEAACRFSYDSLYGEGVSELPFGFHGKGAFAYLASAGLFDAARPVRCPGDR
jgi:hypothetical protein